LIRTPSSGDSVSPAPLTITANSGTKIYGQTYPVGKGSTAFTAVGLKNGDVIPSVVTASGGASDTASVGIYNIRPMFANGGAFRQANYTITYIKGKLIVNPAPLTITANDQTKAYGAAMPKLTLSYSGFVNNDNPSSLTTPPAIHTPANSNSLPGTYPITVSHAVDSNYAIRYVPGTLTVTQGALTITANNAIKCNGVLLTFAGTEFTVTGLATGDAVTSVTLTSAGASSTAAAGSYPITVSAATGTNLNNYSINYVNGTLTVESPLVLSIIQVNPDCIISSGSLSSSATGGISPYTYKVNTTFHYDPSGAFISNPYFGSLSPGYYTYAIKDANSCLDTVGLTIAQFTQTPVLTTSSTSTQACYGSGVTITTNVSGGNSPFTYTLNTNGIQGTPVGVSGRYFYVTAGDYTITVTDVNGCKFTTPTVEITQPSQPLTISEVVMQPTCTTSTGSIVITASGGYSSNYSYSDNNGSSYQASNIFTGLLPASYYLEVRDGNGCTAVGNATVHASTLSAAAVSGNLQPCYGAMTTISTSGTGGASPYTYSVDATNNFVSSANRYFTVSGSVSGTSHTITVMDANGCTYTTPAVVVLQPSSAVGFTSAVGGQGCTGNALISVTATGGYGSSYTYSDNGGTGYQSGSVFPGLSYGNYTMDVKDANGCAAAAAVVRITALTTSGVQGTLTTCQPGTTIYTVPTGGTSPYTYSLNGGAYVPSGSRFFYVQAGTDYITVKDSVGCTSTTPSVTVTTLSCPGINMAVEESKINTLNDAAGKMQMLNVQIYPNPSSSEFFIELKNGNSENIQLTVRNIIGEKVYETNGSSNQTFRFGINFGKGMYILQARQGTKIYTAKLIKG